MNEENSGIFPGLGAHLSSFGGTDCGVICFQRCYVSEPREFKHFAGIKIRRVFLVKCDAACKSNRKNHWSHVAVDSVFWFPKLAIKLHLASISLIGMDAFQCKICIDLVSPYRAVDLGITLD